MPFGKVNRLLTTGLANGHLLLRVAVYPRLSTAIGTRVLRGRRRQVARWGVDSKRSGACIR